MVKSDEIVGIKFTYPRNGRSLLATLASAGVSSGTWSRSSVGKYEVSVTELKWGINGASIWRIVSQSTP